MPTEQSAFIIRDATAQDAAVIDAVLRSLGWFAHLDEIAPTETQARLAHVIAEKCQPEGDNTLLVAEAATSVVAGYPFVHWLPNLIFGGEGYVSELFVLPDARGHSIGTALLDEAKRRGIARGFQRLSLFNGRERESYRRGFYPRHGWIERDDTALFMFYLDTPDQ